MLLSSGIISIYILLSINHLPPFTFLRFSMNHPGLSHPFINLYQHLSHSLSVAKVQGLPERNLPQPMMAQEVPEPKFVSLICSISFLQCCWKSGQQLPCSSHSASPRGNALCSEAFHWPRWFFVVDNSTIFLYITWMLQNCCNFVIPEWRSLRSFSRVWAPQILSSINIKKLRIMKLNHQTKPQLLPCVIGKHRICDTFHSHKLYMSHVWRRLPHSRGSTSQRQCTPRYLVLDQGMCEFSTGLETLRTTFPHFETCGKGLQLTMQEVFLGPNELD